MCVVIGSELRSLSSGNSIWVQYRQKLAYVFSAKISYNYLFVTPPLPFPSPEEKGGGEHHQTIPENLNKSCSLVEIFSDSILPIFILELETSSDQTKLRSKRPLIRLKCVQNVL